MSTGSPSFCSLVLTSEGGKITVDRKDDIEVTELGYNNWGNNRERKYIQFYLPTGHITRNLNMGGLDH